MCQVSCTDSSTMLRSLRSVELFHKMYGRLGTPFLQFDKFVQQVDFTAVQLIDVSKSLRSLVPFDWSQFWRLSYLGNSSNILVNTTDRTEICKELEQSSACYGTSIRADLSELIQIQSDGGFAWSISFWKYTQHVSGCPLTRCDSAEIDCSHLKHFRRERFWMSRWDHASSGSRWR